MISIFPVGGEEIDDFIFFFQFLIHYLFDTTCVHTTAKQREKGYRSLPFDASLRTSVLCHAPHKALCTATSAICSPRARASLENWYQQMVVSLFFLQAHFQGWMVEHDVAQRDLFIYTHQNGWSCIKKGCLQVNVHHPGHHHLLHIPSTKLCWFISSHRVKVGARPEDKGRCGSCHLQCSHWCRQH